MAARQSAAVESSKVAKYIGTADVRKISAADWRSIGIEEQTQVVWDKSNGFQVSVSELTEAAVKYLDETDSGFVIADISVE